MLRNRMILAATILALPTYLRARSGPEWCTSERCAERSTAEWCAEWCTAERRAERCTAEQRGRQCRESVNSSPQSRLARNRNWKRANRDHSRWKASRWFALGPQCRAESTRTAAGTNLWRRRTHARDPRCRRKVVKSPATTTVGGRTNYALSVEAGEWRQEGTCLRSTRLGRGKPAAVFSPETSSVTCPRRRAGRR
jgi:hypothetical protein